jgi:hypothetical protein
MSGISHQTEIAMFNLHAFKAVKIIPFLTLMLYFNMTERATQAEINLYVMYHT